MSIFSVVIEIMGFGVPCLKWTLLRGYFSKNMLTRIYMEFIHSSNLIVSFQKFQIVIWDSVIIRSW